jgi:hypothetical protein
VSSSSPRTGLEDVVVGYKWDIEPKGGGGDPAVGVVFLLAERATVADAGRS